MTTAPVISLFSGVNVFVLLLLQHHQPSVIGLTAAVINGAVFGFSLSLASR